MLLGIFSPVGKIEPKDWCTNMVYTLVTPLLSGMDSASCAGEFKKAYARILQNYSAENKFR
jgi:hypothetical protein